MSYRLTRFCLLSATLALLAPLTASAQQTARSAADTVYARAQQLVAEGNGEAGRALVAARLQSAAPGSPEYVEALFWRAALAATAAEAEGDYRRIIVEHSTSPRAEDALTRLAQLELARGRHSEALRHLERLAREYPASPSRARTHYWMARVLFDENQMPRACARMADARAAAPADDAELRNQIEYHGQRCEGVDTSTAGRAPAAQATRPPAAQQRPPAAAQTPPAQQQRPVAAPPAAPAQQRAPAAGARAEWTVQVAAVATQAAAEELQARVRARGHEARVVRVGNLWRVRVGRYASRADAAAVSARLTEQRIDNFVTEAEPR